MSKQDYWERYKKLGAQLVEKTFALGDAKSKGDMRSVSRLKRDLRIIRRARSAALSNAMGVA